MPLGIRRTDLNTTGTSYRSGSPVTLPKDFGNPVAWIPSPNYFGNPIPSDGQNRNEVTWLSDPAHFGNVIGGGGLALPILKVTGVLTAAQIKAMTFASNTWVQILPAPGVGLAYVPFYIITRGLAGSAWTFHGGVTGVIYGNSPNTNTDDMISIDQINYLNPNLFGVLWSGMPHRPKGYADNSPLMFSLSPAGLSTPPTGTGTNLAYELVFTIVPIA